MSEYRSTPTAELHRDGISSKRAEPTNTIGCDLYNQPFLTKKRGRKKKRERTNEGNRTSKAKSVRQTERKRESQYWKGTKKFFRVWFGGRKGEKEKGLFFSSFFLFFSTFILLRFLVCVCVSAILFSSFQTGNSKGIRSDPFVPIITIEWGRANRQQENGQKNKIRRAR
jgi:hypothetical protein